MSYGAFLMVLLSILIISLIWVLMVKKEQQVFVKRNIKYMLYAALLFLVLGSGGGLLRKLLKFFPDIYLIFLQIGFLGLGILHRYKLDTYFNWKEALLVFGESAGSWISLSGLLYCQFSGGYRLGEK